MWLLMMLVGLVLVFVVGFFWLASGSSGSAAQSEPSVQVELPPSYEPPVQRVLVAEPESAVDLRRLEGTSCAVAGITHWVKDDERRAFNGDCFYLRREPSNKHDANAVAVYAGERKFWLLVSR